MPPTTSTIPAGVKTTLDTLKTLLPLAASVTAMIAGVPVPVTLGLGVAQALLPVADEFLVKLGDKTIAIDTTGITDADAIAALRDDLNTGWPVLTFKPE